MESKRFKTEQENFWAGEFGDDYINRNHEEEIIASNTVLFAKVLSRCNTVKSCIEFGANIGMNIVALKRLLSDVSFSAIEINTKAAEILAKIPGIEVINDSILSTHIEKNYDLVLIKGVLIHQSPDELPAVYDVLYQATRKYILIAEYFSQSPVSIPYRGHEKKLFKRDFAGEMLDLYPDLSLLDYGFVYSRDPLFPLDNINWFLLAKN